MRYNVRLSIIAIMCLLGGYLLGRCLTPTYTDNQLSWIVSKRVDAGDVEYIVSKGDTIQINSTNTQSPRLMPIYTDDEGVYDTILTIDGIPDTYTYRIDMMFTSATDAIQPSR